jgi:hypothetical protein
MTFLALKVVRLLLTVSVSIWLAGGCLMSCGTMATAAQRGEDQAAVEADSCQAAQEHHCCSKAKPVKQTAAIDPKVTESLLALATLPRAPMGDCPLAMSAATAIAAKASSNSADSDQTTNAPVPLTAGNRELRQKHFAVPLVPNRGPTYLRCCVFLI